jgi:hypothetical protein
MYIRFDGPVSSVRVPVISTLEARAREVLASLSFGNHRRRRLRQ